MKPRILILATLALASCSSLTPSQQALATNLLDAGISAVASKYNLPPSSTTVLTTTANNLFSTASGAQANVGSTPSAVNLASYSAVPALGSTVTQSIGPNTPITQATVNAIFAAAAGAK